MSKSSKITFTSLVMMTIVSVDSIRNLPAGALFGSTLVFYYLFAALIFFVPAGLVSADLATMFDTKSGIYRWVKEALGQRMGLVAIWLQWIENVVWYPAILSFASASLVYMLSPQLAENPMMLSISILTVFWTLTWMNCKGMQISAGFSTICAVVGLILPMSCIIILGVLWYGSGHVNQLHFEHMIPHLQSNTWVSLTAVMLSLCGIEVATVHAEDVVKPRKTFPRALIASTIIIVLTLILGSLSIANVVPHDQLSLVAGIMQTVDRFLSAYHLRGLLELFALMIVVGVLGSVSNWIIAPTRGLYQAACDGYFPAFMKKSNPKDAPVGILWLQGIIVTALSVTYLMFPNVSDVYWLLTVVAAELYMMMYILMFVAHIFLRLRHAKRAKLGLIQKKWHGIMLSVMGIFGCILTLAVGLIEPESVHMVTKSQFPWLVIVALVLFTVPPLFFYNRREK